MTSFLFARPGVLVRLAASFALAILAVSCSSNVSGPTPVDDPARVTIQPETAVLYSGLPTTFTVSGGTGTYSITSTNQSIVEVPAFLNGRSFTVVPAAVVTDTAVTITVRDSGTAPLASATLTVRAGTVNNDIAVIPTGTQGGNCAPAVCSGGDAVVSARVSQGGTPLPGRGVRLDVISGDFRFITSQPGVAEVLSTSTTQISDESGGVLSRIRVLGGAANQTGVVQVTDIGTGAFRRTTFLIAQATGSSPGFFTVPSSITFSGPNDQQCATGGRADVYIFGGTPPYQVGNAGSIFSVSQNLVLTSGGSFYIAPNGTCADNIQIVVVDSAGRTSTVTVSNVVGTLAIPELVVSPDEVTISSCTSPVTVAVAGGTGNFVVTPAGGSIYASPNVSQRLISIGRVPNTPGSTPLAVGVSSGTEGATVTVNLVGEALNTRCDGAGLSVTPGSVLLTSCSPVNLTVPGGSGTYSASVDNSVITASIVGGILTVRRPSPSQAYPAPVPGPNYNANVFVSDGTGVTRAVPVTLPAGSGLPACP